MNQPKVDTRRVVSKIEMDPDLFSKQNDKESKEIKKNLIIVDFIGQKMI